MYCRHAPGCVTGKGVKPWTEPKRRGVLSPEQRDFKARRKKAIARRHRAWLRKAAAAALADENGDGDDFDGMFD